MSDGLLILLVVAFAIATLRLSHRTKLYLDRMVVLTVRKGCHRAESLVLGVNLI